MAKISAEQFSLEGDKYLGRSYNEMDCQAFWEKCAADAGLKKDLAGSNAWYREFAKSGWVGSPEDCKTQFGSVPKGATLFIHAFDGGEEKRGYHDGLGNASHIGIKTGRGKGAIHSSSTRGCVAESAFKDKTVPNGGWNKVGLHPWFSYGERIDKILSAVVASGNDSAEVTPAAEAAGKATPGKEVKPEVEEWSEMRVTAASGTTANLRKAPDTNSERVAKIPLGQVVRASPEQNGWRQIQFGNKTGWMMTAFLEPTEERVTVPKAELEKVYDMIGGMLGLRG